MPNKKQTTKKLQHDRVTKESGDVVNDRLARLRELFPDAIIEGKVDFDQLRAALGEDVDTRPERYSFTWAGKRDATRLLQVPSRATLVACPEESVNFDGTGHAFIEGENLEVLKLLYKSYAGRVKMIYIDPPYNTGGDFVYPDDFADPLDRYLKLTGQKNGNGDVLTTNPETNGRYHSAWLSMMYPRLFVARQLLSDTGVIFVSIDDHEMHNLRMVMNEVFGEECFKNTIIFRRGIKSVQAQFDTVDALTVGHEYIVMYAKGADARFRKLEIQLDEPKPGTWNNHWRGTNRPTMRYELFGITPDTGQWRWGRPRSLAAKANYERLLKDMGVTAKKVTQEQIDEWYLNETEATQDDIDLLRLSPNGKPEHYVPPGETKLGSDLWTDLGTRGSAELAAILGHKVFDNPKPVPLVARMLQFITEPETGDVVLDFFAGSGTTAQAVLEQNREDGGNRRFVMVQLPEPTKRKKPDGSVVESPASRAGYATVADIAKERIRRVIKEMRDLNGKLSLQARDVPEDLGFRVFKLAASNYLPWAGVDAKDPEAYAKQLALYTNPLVSGWKPENVIWEVAIKEGYGLTATFEKVAGLKHNKVYHVADPDKGQSFRICLDETLHADDVKKLALTKDSLFICRDKALDDEKAANLALQCRLKTI